MDIELDWTGGVTPGRLASRIIDIPGLVNDALGDRGDVIGAAIVESAQSEAPVDTGALKASIDHNTGREGTGVVVVTISADVEYAIFVEFGTRYMGAQPFIRPAIRENTSTIESELSAAINEAFRDV